MRFRSSPSEEEDNGAGERKKAIAKGQMSENKCWSGIINNPAAGEEEGGGGP